MTPLGAIPLPADVGDDTLFYRFISITIKNKMFKVCNV